MGSLSSLPDDSLECDVGAGNSKCPGQAIGPDALANNPNYTSGYVGGRTMLNTNAAAAIDAFGYCYYVNNTSGNSLFVPFRTSPEWLAFINNHPTDVSLINCSRGGAVAIPSVYGTDLRSNQCVSEPGPAYVTAPYAPWLPGAPGTFSTNVTFATCKSPDGTIFPETATAVFTGINSNANPVSVPTGGPPPTLPPGWVLSMLAYKYDGQCGTAENTGSGTTPPQTSELCHVGVATTPTQVSGEWQWICQSGLGGGTPANCTAGPPLSQPISITFNAAPTSITTGGTSTLSWTVANATACTASGDPLNQWAGSVSAAGGTMPVTPANTTTYVLTCKNAAGDTASASATVTVSPASTCPATFNGSLVVLFDDSGSIRSSDFIAAQNFLTKLLQDMNFGPKTLFQLLEFGIIHVSERKHIDPKTGQTVWDNLETYTDPILYTSPIFTKSNINLNLSVPSGGGGGTNVCPLNSSILGPNQDGGCNNGAVQITDAVTMINTLQNYGGDTDIYGPIKRATTSLGTMGGSPRVILLITDGHQSTDVSSLGVPNPSVAANAAKASGIRVMAVGIQDSFFDANTLNAITANQAGTNLFLTPSMSSLSSVLGQLETALCQ